MNNLMRKILLRRSTYTFSENMLRDEDLMSILEEGKDLSNVNNNQSWHFTAIQNRTIIKCVLDCTEQAALGKLKAVNDQAAEQGGCQDILKRVPTLLVISGNGDPKYAEDAANTLFGSMMLAAEKYNIRSCWLTAKSELSEANHDEIRQILRIPEEYIPLSIGVFGYPVDDNDVQITRLDSVVNIIR